MCCRLSGVRLIGFRSFIPLTSCLAVWLVRSGQILLRFKTKQQLAVSVIS